MAEEGAPNGTLVIADKTDRRTRKMRKSLGDAERHSNRHDTSDASESPTGKANMLTLVMGMAVTRAVNELYSLNCQIKVAK